MNRWEFFKDDVKTIDNSNLCLYFAKWYIKSLSKASRLTRISFVGRRLKIKQHKLLHFNNHPFEDKGKGE